MPDGAPLPGWPRFLRAEKAAAYLDVSKSHFLEVIAPKLEKVKLTPGVAGWLREDLDAYVDARADRVPASEEIDPWQT